jgi:hypothetical protein
VVPCQRVTSSRSTRIEIARSYGSAVRAVARVHAVNDRSVAWDDDVQDQQLFILLDQLHYDQENRPFRHTRSYFIEGRFNFTVVRHSPSRRRTATSSSRRGPVVFGAATVRASRCGADRGRCRRPGRP